MSLSLFQLDTIPLCVSTGVSMGEPESAVHGRVTIYSIGGCPHCVQAKATLGGLGVPVRDVDLGKHPELRAAVKELSGRSTVPQIFFNQVHVGGNEDLQKLVRSGQLNEWFILIVLLYVLHGQRSFALILDTCVLFGFGDFWIHEACFQFL